MFGDKDGDELYDLIDWGLPGLQGDDQIYVPLAFIEVGAYYAVQAIAEQRSEALGDPSEFILSVKECFGEGEARKCAVMLRFSN